MQGEIKVGGAWSHPIKNVLTKVTVAGTQSWHNVTSGWVKVSGTWRQWFLAGFLDTFQRTTSATSLGSPDGVNTWNNIRGAWGIVSNTATANSAASSYPISTLTFASSDVTISQDNITPGVGAAFWVTDANNWWATSFNETQTCQTGYAASNPNYGTCYAPSYATYGTCSGGGNPNYGTCSGGGNANYGTCYNAGNANYTYTCGSPQPVYGTCYNAGTYNAYNCGRSGTDCGVGNAYTCVSYYSQYCTASVSGYNSGSPYSCQTGSNPVYYYNCQTGSNPTYYYTCQTGGNAAYYYTCQTGSNAAYYYQYNCVNSYSVNILQAVANTISTITSFTFSSLIVGLKTMVKGSTGQITVTGYSAAGFNSQIGSAQTYTASGYTPTSTHGMILAPSNYGQGSSFSSYEVDYFTTT